MIRRQNSRLFWSAVIKSPTEVGGEILSARFRDPPSHHARSGLGLPAYVALRILLDWNRVLSVIPSYAFLFLASA